MSDRTTGTPNGRPGTSGPESLVRRWNDEAVDAAGQAALGEIQRRLNQTWDVKVGLREILLAEHYRGAIEAQAGKFDVEAGLADIVGPSDAQLDGWAKIPGPTATCDAEVRAPNFYEVFETHRESRSWGPMDVLDRLRCLAVDMVDTLEEIRQSDGVALIEDSLYADTMSTALRSAGELESLVRSLEERLVTRSQAVSVVDRASEVCVTMWHILKARVLAELLPWDLRFAVRSLVAISEEASDLRLPIARLFDPSDDLVDMLL
ncbi:hypothetical protein OOJ91_34215 [Micromonospora lupini]|uniref:hypothetical protein n=1 Tax=Micromonospora lupini TaxID=285679 RepID=UPI0022591AAD|nr:hypothetical protein [Micromonospora lupini]MCX5070905.1 hypothetical protein [Micromonospora lupini]